MCGIVGFIDPALTAADAAPVLARMRAAIHHRGPDEDGQLVRHGMGLGIQRLSIVDLSGGHQPIFSADGKIAIVFNGEIFNHADLRRQREAEGRQFRTRSDTEVVLAQYERFGLDGLHTLNGMFAFALWDGRANELHLVRDRLGVKPLYYFADGQRFYFGSEIKALVRGGPIRVEPNPQAVWDYLTFRYVPAPQTIWRDIYKLPPGHTLTVRPGKPVPAPRRYWDMPYVNATEEMNSGSSAEFGALLRDAVGIRMLADVPVGVFLSGGLDSSAVAASVDRRRFPDLKTFSVALQDAGEDDEREYALNVAHHLRTDHHEVVVSAQQLIDFLPELPVHTDEPLADPTCVPVYFLAREAQNHVKVVLSGEGADEILAGYTFDAVQRSWDEAIAAAAPQARGSWLSRLLGRPPMPLLDIVDQRQAPVPLHITNYLSSDEKRNLFRCGGDFPDSVDVLRRDLVRVRADEPLHQSLYLYCQNWLVEDLLMKADKMTMAASLELRTPFLDYRLVEWAARAPVSAKLGRRPDGGYMTKAVLRDYARSLLPPAIISRPKKGFPVPVFDWLGSRLRSFTLDHLADNPKCARWLEPHAIKAAAERGTSVDASTLDRHRAWNLLVLELWARAWLP